MRNRSWMAVSCAHAPTFAQPCPIAPAGNPGVLYCLLCGISILHSPSLPPPPRTPITYRKPNLHCSCEWLAAVHFFLRDTMPVLAGTSLNLAHSNIGADGAVALVDALLSDANVGCLVRMSHCCCYSSSDKVKPVLLNLALLIRARLRSSRLVQPSLLTLVSHQL